jgi:hypothetical protein
MEKRVCKKCRVEKDIKEFYIEYKNGNNYYLKKCKLCKENSKKVCSINNIDNDIKLFIESVNKQNGWINEIDAFRLLSLYVDKFGVKYYDNLNIEDELCLMWEELKKVYKSL